ncbi:hypothetical protein M408DRAFT_81516 [Serendipita vermifera MAFF 305830]|uniref:Kinesin light chain n=1 Tax=Serendipita vermifera MAFF 305830 TaxID=933852 RepID=A0A0C2W2Q9_SERVB|nr:hypothetical protein M408DRAFT_81516 [Serendipita vermifera MAFF 305830]
MACFSSILDKSGAHYGCFKLRERLGLIVKGRLEVKHPSTIIASANLAVTYGQLGRYAEAEVLFVEVLKQRTKLLGVLKQSTKLLGADHPDTIRASANLAATYGELGRYAEAEALQNDVLQRRTRLLGDQHPHTLLALWSLASTYKKTQQLPEALELATKAHRGYVEILGESHPDTVETAAFLTSLTAEQPVDHAEGGH